MPFGYFESRNNYISSSSQLQYCSVEVACGKEYSYCDYHAATIQTYGCERHTPSMRFKSKLVGYFHTKCLHPWRWQLPLSTPQYPFDRVWARAHMHKSAHKHTSRRTRWCGRRKKSSNEQTCERVLRGSEMHPSTDSDPILMHDWCKHWLFVVHSHTVYAAGLRQCPSDNSLSLFLINKSLHGGGEPMQPPHWTD